MKRGDDVVAGTIGAYDYDNGKIEVGFSAGRAWQGRGFATEALKKVLAYLTENEGIACVTAWCAAENTGSRKVLEKAGMQLVNTEKDGLIVDDRIYDKMIYEYRMPSAKENKLIFIAKTGHTYHGKNQEVAEDILTQLEEWREEPCRSWYWRAGKKK